MAKESDDKRILKKTETTRERASKPAKEPKKRHLSRASSNISKPSKAVIKLAKKEYYLPLPDSKLGRFLNKRRHIFPKYFRESWAELKQVTWPNAKQTFQLTMAVLAFSIFFGIVIALADYGLDKVFEKLIIR